MQLWGVKQAKQNKNDNRGGASPFQPWHWEDNTSWQPCDLAEVRSKLNSGPLLKTLLLILFWGAAFQGLMLRQFQHLRSIFFKKNLEAQRIESKEFSCNNHKKSKCSTTSAPPPPGFHCKRGFLFLFSKKEACLISLKLIYTSFTRGKKVEYIETMSAQTQISTVPHQPSRDNKRLLLPYKTMAASWNYMPEHSSSNSLLPVDSFYK